MFKKNTLLPHSSKQKKDKPSVSLKIGTFVNGIKNSTLLVLQRMHHKQKELKLHNKNQNFRYSQV